MFFSEPPKIIYQPLSAISGIGQCDACSPIVSAEPVVPAKKLNESRYISPEILSYPTDSAQYTAICSPGRHNLSVFNQSAVACLRHFSVPRFLGDIPRSWHSLWGEPAVTSALEKMIRMGLLTPENAAQPRLNEAETLLAAWLHLTDRCNLACSYCYLPHSNADMPLKTGRESLEALFRSAVSNGYRQVKVKYSGGEPLLRFPLIAELHCYAQTLAETHHKELEGVILSNGTLLTPEIIEQIKTLNLRVMISLDGLNNYHDRHRHFPDSTGSFEQVSRAIDSALSLGLIPDISVTVSSRNIAGLPELMQWILERDVPFSINFYRENDFSDRHSDLKLEEEKIISGMLAAYKVIESNLPRRSLLASLADRANLAVPHLRPCSAGRSYLVFDPHGNISKCQMQMNHPVTTLHAEDPLKIIRQDKAGIQNLKADDKDECRSCQWKYWCAGGCPLETYRLKSRYDAKSPNCEIYKALYPHMIRLEAQRLLKTENQS